MKFWQIIIVLIVVVYFSFNPYLIGLNTYPFVLSDLLYVILLAYLLFDIVGRNRRLAIPLSPSLIIFFFAFTSLAFSTLANCFEFHPNYEVQLLKSFVHLVFLATPLLLMIGYPIDLQLNKRFLSITLSVSILASVYSYYALPGKIFEWPLTKIEFAVPEINSRTIDHDPVNEQISLRFENFYRAASFYSEPSILAGYSALNIVLCILCLKHLEKGVFNRKLIWFTAICAGISITLTFSLSGIFQLFSLLAVTFFCNFFGSNRKTILKFFVSFSIIVVIVDSIQFQVSDVRALNFFGTRIVNVLTGGAGKDTETTMAGESFGARLGSNSAGIQIGVRNPIVGAGLGRFYLQKEAKKTESTFVDSFYSSTFAESGYLTVILFTLAFFTIPLEALLLYRRSKSILALEPNGAFHIWIPLVLGVSILFASFNHSELGGIILYFTLYLAFNSFKHIYSHLNLPILKIQFRNG